MKGLRRAGSAALDLCDVACGRFDAFWEYRLAPWDVAAGILIIREGGGVITDLEGNPAFPLPLRDEHPACSCLLEAPCRRTIRIASTIGDKSGAVGAWITRDAQAVAAFPGEGAGG